MAATVTEKKATTVSDDVLLALGEETLPVKELLGKGVTDAALGAAWAQGNVEFGRTKYCVSGNTSLPDLTHNGVTQAKPAVIIEDGLEWSGSKQKWHGRASSIIAESLPPARHYQKYQQEMCVNKEKDVWEWVENPAQVRDRDTRWARRDIDKSEAERLFTLYVRLTDKGLAALQG